MVSHGRGAGVASGRDRRPRTQTSALTPRRAALARGRRPAELAADRDFYAFVPAALRCFLAQTYPERELVIVDGADPVADLVPDDGRVRYVRLDRRTVLGTKRNIAAEAARGDLLVHWDDDWSHPDRWWSAPSTTATPAVR